MASLEDPTSGRRASRSMARRPAANLAGSPVGHEVRVQRRASPVDTLATVEGGWPGAAATRNKAAAWPTQRQRASSCHAGDTRRNPRRRATVSPPPTPSGPGAALTSTDVLFTTLTFGKFGVTKSFSTTTFKSKIFSLFFNPNSKIFYFTQNIINGQLTLKCNTKRLDMK